MTTMTKYLIRERESINLCIEMENIYDPTTYNVSTSDKSWLPNVTSTYRKAETPLNIKTTKVQINWINLPLTGLKGLSGEGPVSIAVHRVP